MARRSWFRRKVERSQQDIRANAERVPSDLFTKCPRCGEILYQKDLEKDLKVCKKCAYHFRLTAEERLDLLLDEGSFQPYDFGLETGDPLDFPEYREKLAGDRARTGLDEAVVAGRGAVEGTPTAICVTDFHFRAGSMNSVVGEVIARTLDEAIQARLPIILVSGSGGGARMQEGLLSLMQMAKTTASLVRLDEAGLLSIVILTDATMGGVLASWASLGDVTLAEPGAMIGFSGERVAAKVQTERPPDNFRTAEFSFEHGMIDRVTPRSELKATVGKLLAMTQPDRALAGSGQGGSPGRSTRL